MAAPLSMKDSSSEDEEILDRLKEAAVDSNTLTQCQTSSSNSKEPSTIRRDVTISQRSLAVELKSLRPDKQNKEEHYKAVIETTPGVRRHIAKKLSSVLDSKIDSSTTCFCSVTEEAPVNNAGVKLMQQSSRFISEDDEANVRVKKQKKKRPPSPSSDSSEDEKLAEAAVSHDFVLSQSSQPYFSNNKPPDVIVSSKGKGSDTTKIDNNNKPENDNDINNDQDSNNCEKLHKKKKKKKHKKCLEDG